MLLRRREYMNLSSFLAKNRSVDAKVVKRSD
jgi:hypothetical protein